MDILGLILISTMAPSPQEGRRQESAIRNEVYEKHR